MQSQAIEKKEHQKKSDVSGILNFQFELYKSPVVKADFSANFNYLSSGDLITINTAELATLINQGLIKPVTQNVRALHRVPDLFKDGFECRFLPDNIQNILTEYKTANSENQSFLRGKLRSALEELLTSHFGLQAIAFDTVYRNTDEEANNVFKSVPLVHMDFPKTNRQRTLDTFEREWKPRVISKNKNYNSNDIEFMVNIWMPLDTIIASPLVLCSNRKIQSTRVFEYNAVRKDNAKFKAVSLTAPDADKKSDAWFYRPGMKGQCYMFNSREGIHTATQFPGETGSRESIEVRLGIFRPNRPNV